MVAAIDDSKTLTIVSVDVSKEQLKQLFGELLKQ